MLDRRTGAARGRLTVAAAGLAAALAVGAPAAPLAAPALLTDPADLGSDTPPAGASLLAQIFPSGLPVPFEAVLDRLRAVAGRANVQTALVPLGRSLQRFAASPDYFASPRIIVAVTGDSSAGPGTLRLADRLFLGYQPAAAIIEAIAYNPAAGRFEFQEIVGYGAADASTDPAERRVCLACHQGQGPIFSRPLWSETNANPAIIARLAPLGPGFHGAPVRQTVDALADFDASTDRAAAIALANRLWADGCPDAPCRAALLAAALRFGLVGATPDQIAAPTAFAARTRALWPDGLATISADLPNRDPMLDGTPGDNPQTTGVLDPETPRDPLPLWHPGADGFPAAARSLAAGLSPGDLAWIDQRLRRRPGPSTTLVLACTTRTARLSSGADETRFACGGAGLRLTGFFGPAHPGRLQLADGAAALDLPLAPGAPPLRPHGRTPDGRRIDSLSFDTGGARLTLTDDLGTLAAALAARAATGSPALAGGPFPRDAVLALIGALLGESNG